MFFRKGLVNSRISKVLIVVVTLIVILSLVIFPWFEDIGYENSLLGCNQFFKAVNGNSIYFKGGKTMTLKFEQSFASLCPSKTIEVDESSVYDAVELSSQCWNKFGKGSDFLGANVEVNESFCFYCGKIQVDSQVDNFRDKFISISNDREINFNQSNLEVININPETLSSSLPSNLDEDLYLFYFITKGDKQGVFDKMQSFISSNLIDLGGWTGMTSQMLSSSDIDTKAGLVLTKSDFKHMNSSKCRTLIPIENYDD